MLLPSENLMHVSILSDVAEQGDQNRTRFDKSLF